MSSRTTRRRMSRSNLIFVTVALTLVYCTGYYLVLSSSHEPPQDGAYDAFFQADSLPGDKDRVADGAGSLFARKLLEVATQAASQNTTKANTTSEPTDRGVYPPPVFTQTELRNGAVIVYVFGMVYMFVALAIVCDEFFVPTLGVITTKLDISDDVAGATFMAAGGSAPELFTSIIGVFLAQNNVGIGTIVGSAVFNILFVIGMCALFSKGVLALTWWPLFRDVLFYSISLGLLIIFFKDFFIEWWEACILFAWYFCYVIFMKFNHVIEDWVKDVLLPGLFCQNRVSSAQSGKNLINRHERSSRTSSSLPILRGGGSARFRHGVLQLLIHTIDPITDNRNVRDKAIQLHAVASLQVVINGTEKADQNQNQNGNLKDQHGVPAVSNGRITIDGTFTATSDPTYTRTHSADDGKRIQKSITTGTQLSNLDSLTDVESTGQTDQYAKQSISTRSEVTSTEPDQEQPLDLSWPETFRERVTYILVAPIIFPLWFVLPDVRNKEKEKWFPIAFIGSIIWIAIYSYLMVWWADVTGTTAGIPPEVMGLTFLAAGTSVPDLITSVIVARKGLGDMAVSSSVGSNIFDITVGLPFPWLLYCIINWGKSVDVNSTGLFCSIILLFGMLLMVITSIAVFKWKMTKGLGVAMFILYGVFLTTALLLEYKHIPCLM